MVLVWERTWRERGLQDGLRLCLRWSAERKPMVGYTCQWVLVRVRGRSLHTLPSFKAGLSGPRRSFCEAEVKSGNPAIGKYSWLRLGSLRTISSA